MINNEDLSSLVKSVDYSDGSIFNIIFCDSKIKADECLSFIQNSLKELGNDKNFVFAFKNRKINLDDLYLDLDSLIRFNSYKKNDFLVLELTFLELSKIYEIEHLFLKMNQLRNSIMNLNLPILLIIPKELKKHFMIRASDFWSIRSVFIEIKSDIVITQRIKDYSYEELEHKDKLSFLLNEYHRLKSLNNEISKYLLMVKGNEIGDFYLKHIFIEEAKKYYEEVSKISYEILEKREDSIEARRDVSVSLEKLANIYLQQGEIISALENYKKSLGLSYEILEKREDSIEAKRDVSVGLEKLANIYLQQGEIISALENYKKSLGLSYEILEKREDSIEAKRDVSVGLEKLANIYLQQGEIISALENYKKSLGLRYEILEKREDSIEAKRDVSVGLEKLANIYLQQGEIISALENYKKSLGLRYEILEKREDSIEAKKDLCVILINVSNKNLYKDYKANKEQILIYLNEAKSIAKNNLGKYDFDNLFSIIDTEIKEIN